MARSHSAGVGEPLREDILSAMMLIRANGLARGRSGGRQVIVDLLCEMLNRRARPVVPRKGSLDAGMLPEVPRKVISFRALNAGSD